MAWNEPGGSGGRDPWGGRRNEQGPPDLDEMVRKLQERLGGLFGRRGGGPGGAGSRGLLMVIIFALAVAWVISGIYIVDEGKRGVVLQFGAYKETTMPGLHWYPRFIQTVDVVDVKGVRSVELGLRPDEALMLTQDENIVDVKFVVQYDIKDPREYLFNVLDPDQTLREVTESAVREIVGKSKMDFVITGGRSEVAARAQQLLQSTLDSYKTGLAVLSVNMQDAQPPEQVQGAFADAVKAREDEQRLKNEAEAYSNDVLPKARGASARIIEEAHAYKSQVIAEAEGETSRFLQVLAEYRKAPEVTRQRLYLDALQSVLENSRKVMLDAKGSNNLLYLPLDQLTGQKPAGHAQGTSVPNKTGSEPPATRSGSLGSRLREDARRREVR